MGTPCPLLLSPVRGLATSLLQLLQLAHTPRKTREPSPDLQGEYSQAARSVLLTGSLTRLGLSASFTERPGARRGVTRLTAGPGH